MLINQFMLLVVEVCVCVHVCVHTVCVCTDYWVIKVEAVIVGPWDELK